MSIIRVALALIIACLLSTGAPELAESSVIPQSDLDSVLTRVREQFHLPAIAAAVVEQGVVTRTGAAGVRRVGASDPVTANDLFHLGSLTKSMTAILAAQLVDSGKLRWSTTLPEIFPELAASMRPEYRSVTLLMLLSHHGGMPNATWPTGSPNWRNRTDPLRAQRAEFAALALRDAPEAPPGTKMVYSNRGYIIVGAILERVTGLPWETLIQKRLFEPLGLASAGFGPAATTARPHQPWPHYTAAGTVVAVPPGPAADNPPILGPAGTVHCSIGDLARYAAFHLAAARGGGRLLKPSTAAMLYHPPFEGDYALGLVQADRPWGGGSVFTHSGSNTMNFAVIWVAPRRNFAVVIACNQGDSGAPEACDAVAASLVSKLGAAYADVRPAGAP